MKNKKYSCGFEYSKEKFLKDIKEINEINEMTEALINTFQNIKIGIKDCNGLELFNGDNITIEVAKEVKREGNIIYERGAFCLKHPRLGNSNIYYHTPLINYSHTCEITKNY